MGVIYNYAERCCLQPAENDYGCMKSKINTAPKHFTTNTHSIVLWNDPLAAVCVLDLQHKV